ncbi:cyclin-K-like isoform X1 [Eriocheir sinensis]|uniref:cyclin-K-like isoform X1 n=2 Tax=Eriocheir sinensis TaxID=95602 RepID=UPI0021C7EE61|nr:cyclin-K-like isoform X1 [Eriocheir sinensis]
MTKRSGWYYEKRQLRHTPSIAKGMSVEQEVQYRREGARFILQVGNKMGLRYETMATGVVYFHRFYMVHAFQSFPRHVTACCCLFLAGKVEETPKKCKDIMKTAKSLMDEVTWAEFGTDPREEVMTLERILLQTIKFDFIVEHPYTYLLKYAKCLKGDKKKLPNMVQMAWTFVNDSLCTTLCLQWEPEIIAIALMYLAGKLSKFEVTDWAGRQAKHQRWWDMYVEGISMELLEDICHQVLDLYSPNRSESGGSSSDVSAAAKAALPRRPTTPPQTPIGPPPAKKMKKEEVKSSPVKPEAPVPAQSYQYSYQYSNYPGSYASQGASQAPSPATPQQRYPYQYPASSTQGPPPPQAPPPQAPPPSYQPPPPQQRHYTPAAPVSSQPTPPPPPHYTSQPPPSHYSTPHPPSYSHPPSTATHYPTPPAPQTIPPQGHYPSPHASSSSSSSYYPSPAPPSSATQPTYPVPPSSSYPPPNSYSHSSSRPY